MRLFFTKRIASLFVLVLTALPAMAQEMPTFDLNLNVGMHLAGSHTTLDNNGAKSSDDTASLYTGPASMLALTGTYGAGSITLGLRPFDTYLVDRLYMTLNVAEKEKFVIGIAPTETWYSFGGVLNGINLEGYGNTRAERRFAALYYKGNLSIGLVDGSLNNIVNQNNTVVPRDSAVAYFKSLSTNGITWVNKEIPRLEATYNIKAGMFSGKAYGQYGAYFFDTEVNNHKSSNTVHLLTAGIGGQFNMDSIVLKAHVYGGLNSHLTDAVKFRGNGVNGINTFMPQFKANGNEFDVQNATEFGGALEVGYKFNKQTIARIGGGYALTDISDANRSKNTYALYVNTEYRYSKNIVITPEVAYYSNEDDISNVKSTKTEILYGIKVAFLMF